MTMLLNRSNISFLEYRENEVALAIHVMEEHLYCMSPQLALELSAQLEEEARKVIAKQASALGRHQEKKAGVR